MASRSAINQNRRKWVSLVPYGINEQHPNAYKDIASTIWENRDNLAYAWRILQNGCCDGCSLGTTGMHDWTMQGVHLCALRLKLLRINTMPAMDLRLLENVGSLRKIPGRKLGKLGRLAAPMIRRRGEQGFRRISWDEATGVAADGLKATDPHRVAWFITSRGLTNESYYAHQKVARFFGTNHIDTSARICHAPSTAALSATIGCAATTCSYSDWIGTDLLVFVGTNIANNQPVATKYLHYAKEKGTKVFVVNPYFEPGLERYWVPSVAKSALFGTRFADDFFPVHIGGDVAFFYGALKHMIENEWLDRDFMRARTTGWDELAAKTAGLSWETLERGSGLTRADMRRFAEAFGKARSAIIVWSMGITQHRYGSDNVRAIVNLQLAKGNVGREKTGLMPIRGHSGVQGGAEMGGMPSAYIMGSPVNDENARRFAQPEFWGFEPPTWKGLTAAAMILAAGRGEIDALWQSGGNFIDTLPEPAKVREAVGKIRLRIHQDVMLSSNMLVDPAETVLLLPSATRYEQHGGGTETTTERRVIYTPEIPGPRIEEARDEWLVPVLVARRADPERAAKIFPWSDTQQIREEIDRVCPTYKGIANLRKKGDNFQYGGPRLLVDKFLTPDGKGRFSAIELPEEKVPEGRFLLATRRGKQFNSLIHGEFDPITGATRDAIFISAEDAQRLGLADGGPILLRNDRGEFRGRVKIDRIKPGCLQGHWPEVNVLVAAGCLDPSGVPDYNAVVEIVAAGREALAPTKVGAVSGG
ncbi:MAG TPA: FdhF/YdeP family oxidoreductase [Candidatus Limnocylindrales bacterium]|nr:FdhF/YdeP family oxidoreductase [Candidatus Limnocylindrales bacterium]